MSDGIKMPGYPPSSGSVPADWKPPEEDQKKMEELVAMVTKNHVEAREWTVIVGMNSAAEGPVTGPAGVKVIEYSAYAEAQMNLEIYKHDYMALEKQAYAFRAERDALQAEVTRLTEHLKQANAGFEEYERKFYLMQDERDALREKLEASEAEVLRLRNLESTFAANVIEENDELEAKLTAAQAVVEAAQMVMAQFPYQGCSLEHLKKALAALDKQER